MLGVCAPAGRDKVSSASAKKAKRGDARLGTKDARKYESAWLGKTEMGIWAVGLDAARETTMRYNWKLDEFVATILITGINVETLGTRLSYFAVWGRGRSGQDLAQVTPRLPGNRRSGSRRRQQQSNEDETRDTVVLVSCRLAGIVQLAVLVPDVLKFNGRVPKGTVRGRVLT